MEYKKATENDWQTLSKSLPGTFMENLGGWQYFFDNGMQKFRIRAGMPGNNTGSNIWVTLKDGKILSK